MNEQDTKVLHPYEIAEFSKAIRDRSIKRLESVPDDFINWRLNNRTLSFAHIAQHLINADELFLKLLQSSHKKYHWVMGTEEPHTIIDINSYNEKIAYLNKLKDERSKTILTLTDAELTKTIKSEEGEEMTLNWFILNEIIAHEVYHRGQISAYLKILKGEA